MGIFVKEGVCTEEDPRRKEDWARLLRYESMTMAQDQVVSLEQHIERRTEKEGAEPKELYYIVSHVRTSRLETPCACPSLLHFRDTPPTQPQQQRVLA